MSRRRCDLLVQRRRPLLPILLVSLVATGLAGCADDGPGDDDPPADDDPAMASATLPTWDVGDWWRYRFSDGNEITWAVSAVDGADYILDVDNEDIAFFHAAFAEVSTIGRVARADLAGSQESGPVKFFDWPLAVNKSWTTTWDGQQFAATVVDMEDGRWRIGYENDRGHRIVIYDEAAQWFRTTVAYDANRTEIWRADLAASGAAYTGSLVRWDILYDATFSVGFAEPSHNEFDVPEAATDVWYQIEVWCDPDGLEGDQGLYAYAIRPPESEPLVEDIGNCPHQELLSGTLEPVVGTWSADMTGLGGSVLMQVIVRARIDVAVA